MSVARVATFDEPPNLRDDDDRRMQSLHDLLRSLPGFIAGYELHEATTGRLMSVTLWDSEDALDAGERAVRDRPARPAWHTALADRALGRRRELLAGFWGSLWPTPSASPRGSLGGR